MNVRRLFAGLLLLGLFTMAVRETLDPDMWWHLRAGEYIFQNGIPKQDIFSFTVPENRWITHEWLSEIVMWSVYWVGDFPLLIVIFAGVIASSFWLVYLRSSGRPYLAGFVVLLAALASAPLWGARPQMFNLLFTACFIFLIEGFKERKIGKKVLWLLPILTIFWANLHSGYLFGIALIAGYIIGESLQQLTNTTGRRGLSWAAIRWLTLMGGLSFLAAAINPNGPELWIYPFYTLGSSAMQQYIQEWQSPDFHRSIYWPFAALVGLGILSWIANRKPPALTDLLLFSATALAGLISVRHIPLFSLLAVPIVSRYWLSALDGTRFYPLFSGQLPVYSSNRRAALNWLLVFLALLLSAIWIGRKIQNNDTAVAEKYPVAAVSFLEDSGLSGSNGYNSYHWGGYLIWRDFPVYIDGRADVYGDEFIFSYLKAFNLTNRWRDPLENLNIDYVLIGSTHPLSSLLTEAADWQEAYKDKNAIVFIPAEE